MGASTAPAAGSASPGPGLGFTGLDVTLLVALGIIWGSAYVFIREGLVFGASPLLFAGVRYGLSAVLFVAIALARREPVPDRSSIITSAVIGGIFFIGLYGGFLYWGEQYTTGGYASVLSTTGPLLTVVIAYFLLPAEALGSRALAGLAVGLVGAIVLVVPELEGGPGGGWLGPAFIVAAFASTSLGSVWLRRVGRGRRQTLWQIGAQFAVGCALLLVASAALPYPEAFPLTVPVLAALASLVVVSSVVGYFIYFQLHHRIGPVRANTVTYLIPLAGIGIGTGFFGEPVDVWEIAGFLITVLGVTLIILGSSRRD